MTGRPTMYRLLGDGDIGVWTTYEDRLAIKALPGSHWDPDMRCWRVPEEFRSEVDQAVRAINGDVDAALAEALQHVFHALPGDLRKPTQRALSRVWHPDAGGTHDVMLALNAAWDGVG